jgi:iron complex transport system ATP-binding protein
MLLQTTDLSIGYSTKHVIAKNLNLKIEVGQFIGLIGANGTGKSTLIKTLAGLQPKISGQVLWQDKPCSSHSAEERAKLIGLVLTERTQLAYATAYEVAAFGRFPYTGFSGKLSPHDKEIVARCLNQVGALGLASRRFSELSDGERQKIMIARALAQEPQVLILDEPTAFLDYTRRIEIMHLLRDIAHQGTCAILLSTHELDLALQTVDQLWLLDEKGEFHQDTPLNMQQSGLLEANFGSGILINLSLSPRRN